MSFSFITNNASAVGIISSATFIGGTLSDSTNLILTDSSGNIYVAGNTSSLDFPLSASGYDKTFNGGPNDIFIAKFSSNLTTLQAMTFYGGIGIETPLSMVMDNSGNIYITGDTDSSNLPVTGYDKTYNGNIDCFVAKFNSGLTSLLGATYLGSNGYDVAHAVALDNSQNPIITGTAMGNNYPTSAGAYDTTSSQNGNAFITKLDSSLNSITASTLLEEVVVPLTAVIDSSNNIIIAGMANAGLPTTALAYDKTNNGGYDGFVSKFNSTLTTLSATTYIGGNAVDMIEKIVLDSSGNIFAAGSTNSNNFPITSGAYDTTYNSPASGMINDGFVIKLTSNLSTISASTYLGGSGDDIINDIKIDASGNIYMVGTTGSNNFPTTADANDTSFNGVSDIFVSKMPNTLNSLIFSTYAGGTSVDSGDGLTKDSSGNLIISGHTGSSNFPVTSGAFDTSYNGGDGPGDAVIVKISSSTGTPISYNPMKMNSDKQQYTVGSTMTFKPAGLIQLPKTINSQLQSTVSRTQYYNLKAAIESIGSEIYLKYPTANIKPGTYFLRITDSNGNLLAQSNNITIVK